MSTTPTAISQIDYSASDYICQNLVDSENTNFFKKHVLARGGYLLLAPVSIITAAIDTIIGLGVGLASIATVGKHAPTFYRAQYHLVLGQQILARLYQHCLQFLNPSAIIDDVEDGLTTDVVKNFFIIVAKDCYRSDSIFKRHVASRLTYALMLISCAITRLIDGVIGIIAALFSFLTFGHFDSLNNAAYRGLFITGIVTDLFYCTVKIVNPTADPVSKL